jgi:hypothetical protein
MKRVFDVGIVAVGDEVCCGVCTVSDGDEVSRGVCIVTGGDRMLRCFLCVYDRLQNTDTTDNDGY